MNPSRQPAELPAARIREQHPRSGHGLVSLPAAVLLLVCLGLPGYQECGHVSTVGGDFWLSSVSLGVVAGAIVSFALRGSRGAVRVLLGILPAINAMVVMAVYAALSDAALAGLALAIAAAFWIAVAIAIAIAEPDRDLGPRAIAATRPLAVVALGSYLVIALVVPWQPPPSPPPPDGAADTSAADDDSTWADLARFLQAESHR